MEISCLILQMPRCVWEREDEREWGGERWICNFSFKAALISTTLGRFETTVFWHTVEDTRSVNSRCLQGHNKILSRSGFCVFQPLLAASSPCRHGLPFVSDAIPTPRVSSYCPPSVSVSRSKWPFKNIVNIGHIGLRSTMMISVFVWICIKTVFPNKEGRPRSKALGGRSQPIFIEGGAIMLEKKKKNQTKKIKQKCHFLKFPFLPWLYWKEGSLFFLREGISFASNNLWVGGTNVSG